MLKFKQIYETLSSMHGPQGWWPLLELHNHKTNKGTNPTKTGSMQGYHPNNYTYPQTERQKFEICLGAILTQNTAWPNVEKALTNLNAIKAIDQKIINEITIELLKELIRPAGYFNQKSIYLKEFTKFFLKLKGNAPSRERLLEVKGIGNETADSILLYAYRQPEFVVDAYTRRIFTNLKIIKEEATYMEIKGLFESNLKKDFKIFQEYHALIVEHAKKYYLKKEDYNRCPLLKQKV